MNPAHQAEVYPQVAVTRGLPANYDAADSALFAKALTRELPPTLLQTWRKVAVLPDGAVFKHLHVVPQSLRNAAQLARYNHKTALKYYLTKRPLWVPRLLHFTEEWSLGYFHWFCDALPRLWVLRDHWHTHHIMLPKRYRVPYVVESLALWGLTPTFYPENRYLLVGTLQLCSMVAPTGNYRPAVLQAVAAALTAQQTVASPLSAPASAIFISRSRAPRRYIENEPAISEALALLGVRTVCMEAYSFSEQIAILRDARVLIGLHGAGLTNMLFMPPGGAVLELRFAEDAHNNAYFSLAHAMGHRYYYLKGQGSHPDTHSANLVIDPAVVAATVRTILQG